MPEIQYHLEQLVAVEQAQFAQIAGAQVDVLEARGHNRVANALCEAHLGHGSPEDEETWIAPGPEQCRLVFV